MEFNWDKKENIIVKLYKTKFWTNVLLYKSEKIGCKAQFW